MSRKLGLVVTTALLMALATPQVSAAAGDPTYYVSLGDSAAAGFQPTGSSSFGYADQLATQARQHAPDLRLVKLGCPGETTASLISGTDSPCDYAAGSQLNRAKRFLRAHRGSIAFVTINVGVNDVLNVCLEENFALEKACVESELPGVVSNLKTILAAVRQIAPGVPIAGMSYWNPFLGLWVVAGPDGEALARKDDKAMRALNEGLVSTYHDEGAVVAEVASHRYFDIADFTTQVSTRWGRLPVNVANTCKWTWFCDEQVGPDPHPNTNGYGVIADAFAAALHV
jgi:lysophospholipase L1-like esterase